MRRGAVDHGRRPQGHLRPPVVVGLGARHDGSAAKRLHGRAGDRRAGVAVRHPHRHGRRLGRRSRRRGRRGGLGGVAPPPPQPATASAATIAPAPLRYASAARPAGLPRHTKTTITPTMNPITAASRTVRARLGRLLDELGLGQGDDVRLAVLALLDQVEALLRELGGGHLELLAGARHERLEDDRLLAARVLGELAAVGIELPCRRSTCADERATASS